MNQKIYIWHGIDEHGMRINGQIYAENIATVKKELIKKNISPLKIEIKLGLLPFSSGKKIHPKDILDFSRQLATLINAQIPLFVALNIIEQSCEHTGLRTLIGKLKKDIEAGLCLSAALKKHKKYFDNLFCNLIYAGEQSGTLDVMLNNIAHYQEKTADLKRKINKALLYPSVILATAIIVTGVLLIFVVPQFAKLFHGFGAELPLYTRLVIKTSSIIIHNFLFIILGIISIIISFKYMNTDKILLKAPIIGSILKKAVIARFSRTLAITFKAGLPLSDALQIIADTVNNKLYQQAILIIREQVAGGQTISAAITNNSLFPIRARQMITIGEESGALDSMLNKIAEYYENEVNYLVDNLNNLLEPAIMVILGILIGGLIIGMYLPIFRLGTII
jgi:type IV pilus assembly protein PilC